MMTDHRLQRRNLRRTLFAGLLGLVGLAILLAAYSGYFHSSFHFDDSHVIENNVYIRSLKNAPQFFASAATTSSLPANSNYRPLVTLSLAIDYWLGQNSGPPNPLQFHVTQFILLVFLGVLLFFFFRHLVRSHAWRDEIALLASLVFCVHTVNTETLNIISSRSELLSALGILGAFLIYFYSSLGKRYFLYLLPMMLGALAKPPAVMFAPLLFVYVFLFETHDKPGRFFLSLKKTWPAFAGGFLLFVFVTRMEHPEAVYSTLSRWDYALNQPFVWFRYFSLFFIPVGLTADSDWKLLDHWYDTRFFAGLFLIGVLSSTAWLMSRRTALRPAAFGLAWFLLALLPASSFFPLAEITNEHRVFFPYIGLSLACVYGVVESLKKRPVCLLCLSLLITGGLAWGTYERNKVWRTEETLWYDVTLKSPTNGRALMNYGLTQMSQGKYRRAKEYFERALVFNPFYAALEINLGIVNSSLGDLQTAETHFQRALSLQPRFAEGHYFYGQWLNQQGRAFEAITHLETAVAISPALASARSLLMRLYATQGLEQKLQALVRQSLALWPEDPVAKSYLKKP